MSESEPSRLPGVTPALIILLAINLRPALTSVGPLIEDIRASTGISVSEAGVISSLPLVVFGVFAPLAHLQKRIGAERLVVAALLLLIVGLLVRSFGSALGLFAGTIVFAAGIAVCNVVVPALIKRDFPSRIQSMTTVYAFTLGVSAAVASGLSAPIAHALPGGWQTALAIWCAPALVAAYFWGLQIPGPDVATANARSGSDTQRLPVWHSPVAWFVAAFMGLQSLSFYAAIAWFPSFLLHEGYAPIEAGALVTLLQVAGLVSSVGAPQILKRLANQSSIACLASAAMVSALLGMMSMPKMAVLWMILFGAGVGCSMVLALAFIGLRSESHGEAASLSVMTQSLGYLLAAVGPLLLGVSYDHTGGWAVPLATLAALAVLQAVVGVAAGRARTLFGS
ncbi:CynX/NimT family MFS transporter [Pigmentiphaga kullae]|uniref:CP family cyanate transporter-like MFS transporter n=1 Tax=Pigmentiphaga kullae TaxID=151784 RepID=A0A4Q7NN20_9BURK|nr:MFS transporter [Pigmentiphaga kullae]RZS86599.1 CP family cyanate transporter-like MFS transporter [Pigmentiphaga kullae]